MSRHDFKFKNVSYREYLEMTTRRIQYYWTGPCTPDRSGASAVLSKYPWHAQIKPADEWIFVGAYRTAREAKTAAMESFIGLKSAQLEGNL